MMLLNLIFYLLLLLKPFQQFLHGEVVFSDFEVDIFHLLLNLLHAPPLGLASALHLGAVLQVILDVLDRIQYPLLSLLF